MPARTATPPRSQPAATAAAQPSPAGLVLAALEQALRAQACAEAAAPMQAYMLNQFAFLGIRAPARRSAVRSLLRSPLEPAAVLDLAEALWALPEREFQYTAVDLLARQHKHLGLDALPRLLALLRRKAWWDSVDALAGVIGDILLQAHRQAGQPAGQRSAVMAYPDGWLHDPDRWVRRLAMLHQLGWREQTDVARLLRYAQTLAGEGDFFIRKAIGWALRDYARTDPATVRDFLAAQGARLSPLTRREAGKHLG